jgi:two-component system chemotaxis sensor kinase CheA
VRNAVDHGVESPEERIAAGKPQSLIQLTAERWRSHPDRNHRRRQGHESGRPASQGHRKGLIDQETANGLDEKQCLQLIFMPGFSTKDQISSVSGRAWAWMWCVPTSRSSMVASTSTAARRRHSNQHFAAADLAILPVLVVRACNQPFAVPLAMVREIITIDPNAIQEVSGKPTIVVR